MADNALWDAAIDLETAAIELEDIQNTLTVFDKQLCEWWAAVKSFAPAKLQVFDEFFHVAFSLLTVSRKQLHAVINETSDHAKKAYAANSASKEYRPT